MVYNPKNKKRSFGILIHPTSLPGKTGYGTFGEGLKEWIELLSKYKINSWQFLPLTPTDETGSPYSSPSSFALNPWFLDMNELIKEGYILKSDLMDNDRVSINSSNTFDFKVPDLFAELLGNCLAKNWQNQTIERKNQCEEWNCQNKWVLDYSIFMTLKEQFKKKPWWLWPKEFKNKNEEEIREWLIKNKNKVLIKRLIQWHLHRQWLKIRRFAKSKGIDLIGDLPFYVSRDSVDVWSNRSLFSVSLDGQLIFQSGVPPDYFSDKGQLWGTPVYTWKFHQETNFKWWISRFKRQFELVDILRLDHFRALAGFWRIAGNAKNAIEGKWINSPGKELLNALKIELNVDSLPIIAEDLGIVTSDVNLLRDDFQLPGMKILQFAFDGNKENPYLPENIKGKNWVVYTGTHDNETTISWWEGLDTQLKERIKKQYNFFKEPSWNLIELGMSTNANLFITPIQDILSMDNTHRMNTPGTSVGNWKWKLALTLEEIEDSLKKYGKLGTFHNRGNI